MGQGMARIQAFRTDGWAFIEIEDNAGIFHEKETDDGLGIKIVDKRIKFLFGNDSGIPISCVPNEMTRVTVKIPLEAHCGMMRALIVDDEIHAREELEALLQETGEFTVAGKCANALEALQAIKKEKPDVLFLDIQMPVINGFELLSMIDEELMPMVVFVTAYDEYALKAFEENALDYLLKPVEKERLAKTVEKLKKRFAEGRNRSLRVPISRRYPASMSSKIKLIDMAEVEYVRSGEAGVHVVLRPASFTRSSPSRSSRTRRTSSGATSSS